MRKFNPSENKLKNWKLGSAMRKLIRQIGFLEISPMLKLQTPKVKIQTRPPVLIL